MTWKGIHHTARIHQTAFVEPGAEIGEGTVIGPFSLIREGAKIGKNCSFTAFCEIRENVVVGDNVIMGSRCSVSANCVIGNNVTIKYGFAIADTPDLVTGEKVIGKIDDGAMIGINVVVMPGCDVGKNCIIGACSQVRCSVPDNQIWYGNPAKYHKDRDV